MLGSDVTSSTSAGPSGERPFFVRSFRTRRRPPDLARPASMVRPRPPSPRVRSMNPRPGLEEKTSFAVPGWGSIRRSRRRASGPGAAAAASTERSCAW
jgi:hypothetical protein